MTGFHNLVESELDRGRNRTQGTSETRAGTNAGALTLGESEGKREERERGERECAEL